jgi:hypothetical protein
MADYTPVFTGGVIPKTMQASGAVTGGTFVMTAGAGLVATATAAAANIYGVAAHDAATGTKVTVWPIKNVTHEIASTGTIAVGDGITSGASGVAATVVIATGAAAGTLQGIAETGATGGALVRFLGR